MLMGAEIRAGDRLDEVRTLAEQRPQSAAAQFNLGLAYAKRGLVDRAEKAYRKALALNPDLVEAWVNLGGVLLLKWDFLGCLEANQEALKRRDDLRAHHNIGQAFLYLGNQEGLIRATRRVLELDPGHAAGHYFLAVGLLAQGQVREARQELAQATARGYRPLPEFLRSLERAEQELTRTHNAKDPGDGNSGEPNKE